MEEEYITSNGYKIFYGILAVSFFIFTIYLSIINYKGSYTVCDNNRKATTKGN